MEQYQANALLQQVTASKAVTKIAIGLAATWLMVAWMIRAPMLEIAAAIALFGDVAAYFLHRWHKDTAARIIWLQGSNIGIFMGTQVVHPDSMISLMLFAMMSVAFIIFSWRHEKKLLILNTAIPILFWFVALAGDYRLLGPYEVGQDIAGSLGYLSGITAFTLTISIVSYFTHIAIKVEKALIEARNQAQYANNSKSEFLAVMSHELRTPLTSLIGSLGLINGGAAGEVSSQTKEMAKLGLSNANRLLLLINDILDISKIEAGKLEYHMKSVEVNALIANAIQGTEHYGRKHGVTFKFLPESDALWVSADADRLTQVINNLLSNAAKFSSGSDTVMVTTEKDGDEILIRIVDYGIGIPEESRSRIFSQFYQVDSSDTRKTGGTGLGLNISKSIIEAHQGTIEFESEQGKGTTFTIKLKKLSPPDVDSRLS